MADGTIHEIYRHPPLDGVCFGQKVVHEKENEIVAIPELLEQLMIQNSIITMDAMGTQTKIAEQIIQQKAEYVLAVKNSIDAGPERQVLH